MRTIKMIEPEINMVVMIQGDRKNYRKHHGKIGKIKMLLLESEFAVVNCNDEDLVVDIKYLIPV